MQIIVIHSMTSKKCESPAWQTQYGNKINWHILFLYGSGDSIAMKHNTNDYNWKK